MNKLDILYTTNDKYLDICLASILSLIRNGGISKLRLHIITSDFTKENYQKLDKVLIHYNCEYYIYDINKFDINKYNIPNWRGTQIANARLFFQDIIKNNLSNMENLLYLDSDLIVVNRLNDLEEYKNNAICAVKDSCSKAYLEKMGGLSKYFNSGVLFFNVNEWLNNNYQDELIHFLENNKLQLTYPDQDILNCALDGKIVELPINYNLSANAYLFNSIGQKLYYNERLNYSHKDVCLAKQNPKILHSTGILGIKPWMKNKVNPFNDLFMEYILEVNPEFKKVEISKLKKVLSTYPTLFKIMVLIKVYMPDKIQDYVRKITS